MAANKNVILDSNIIIYTGLVTHHNLRQWLQKRTNFVSSASKIEVLGYHKLTPKDKKYFKNFFQACKILPIHLVIVNSAIKLKQQKSMSLGDAIIAATALDQRLPLVTANVKDFEHIEQLELINPLSV